MTYVAYLIGASISCACAVLLLRGYARERKKLLFWTGLCFLGLSVANALVFLGQVVLKQGPNLYFTRLATAAASMLVLLYGLIKEKE